MQRELRARTRLRCDSIKNAVFRKQHLGVEWCQNIVYYIKDVDTLVTAWPHLSDKRTGRFVSCCKLKKCC